MALVRFFAGARAAMGTSEITLECATLQELVEHCSSQNPRAAEVLQSCSFLLDGLSTKDQNASLIGIENIDVLPKFAGG